MDPNSRYWERRLAKDMFDEISKVETSFSDITALFLRALLYMQMQAEDVFEKYRDKHGLTDEEAEQLLESMTDPTDLDEMQEKLRNTADREEKKELIKKLEAPAYQERIRRAKELQENVNTVMKDLAAKEEEKAAGILKEAADDGYHETIYRTQQRAEAGFSFSKLNPTLVEEAVHTNFSGKEFSERVWGNTEKLAQVLKEELVLSVLTQRSERETALAIAQRMGKGLMEARRLVRTESNRLYTEFAMKGLEEAGIEKYMFLATLDLRTSKMCREHDGKIYKVKERKTGDNCPPLHPWCRSTVMGIISEALLSKLNRDALDPETGKRIKVPLSMTYAEWHKKYVKGRGQDMAEKEKQPQSRNFTREQYDRYRNRGVGPDSYEEFIKLKGDPEEWAKLQAEYRKAKEVPKKSKKKKAVQPKAEGKVTEVHVEPEKVEGNAYRDQKNNKTDETITASTIIECEDITQQMLDDAKPGEGELKQDENALESDKETTEWIHGMFGGDIHCLEENSEIGKMPDSIWNGMYCEYKAPTSKNAIDDRIRKGNKQLLEALTREGRLTEKRCLVIDISGQTIVEEEAVVEVIRRARQRYKGPTVVIVKNGQRFVKSVYLYAK